MPHLAIIGESARQDPVSDSTKALIGIAILAGFLILLAAVESK